MQRLAEHARRFPQHLPATAGRLLLVDGDALAYTQAGAAGTSREQARMNVITKVREFARRSGATETKVLLTARNSHKGMRYAVATVKPYQGKRSSSRRPENWEYLRELLEARAFDFEIHETATAEADDLFAMYSHKLGCDNVVVATQDKDMRMVPGIHLDWDDMNAVVLQEGESFMSWGKQYGIRWFWQQMLQGDPADHVPGLPKLFGKLCGEVGARQHLARAEDKDQLDNVRRGYEALYGADCDLHMMEQGILLWMRRKPVDVFDVANPAYGPLAPILTPAIRATIEGRIHAPIDQEPAR